MWASCSVSLSDEEFDTSVGSAGSRQGRQDADMTALLSGG